MTLAQMSTPASPVPPTTTPPTTTPSTTAPAAPAASAAPTAGPSSAPSPTIDVPVVRPLIGRRESEAVAAVLASGHVVQGEQVATFEQEFAAVVEGRECVAVGSGTAALHLALLAAGIGPGDEVIVPSFTFAATANAVRMVGADPVFVDIDPVSYCMDPEAAAAAVTPRTAGIIPVHLFGHVADMPALGALAQRHGLLVLEDAAQAHDARLDGRPAGSFGSLAAFSFYATKNMTTGEGGMVVTDDPALARTLRLLRNQGMEQRYLHEAVGLNERMTDLAAAIGRVQLQQLAGWNEARRANAATLTDGIGSVVQTPVVGPGATHVFHQYTVRHEQRDALAAHLAGRGIGTSIHYPRAVHDMPAYAQDARWAGLDLPRTREACAQVLALPVHPALSERDLERVVQAVCEFSPGGTA